LKEDQYSEWSWPVFVALVAVQMWAAHAFAFFIHEYAHSFTAWLLGWKGNPLALNYAHPTLLVLLTQLGISENVDYAPIFASGHGRQAAFIAAAGGVIGNALITFPLSRWGYAIAKRRGLRGWAMFAYWVCVASVGNFIDYVPVRTFTNEGDMGTLERGLGWTPWTVLALVGIPTTIALVYFLLRIEPSTLQWLFPYSFPRRIVMVALTAFSLFCFYGAAGWSGGGPTSHMMSLVSVCAVFPLTALVGGVLVRRHSVSGSALSPGASEKATHTGTGGRGSGLLSPQSLKFRQTTCFRKHLLGGGDE